jgi:hypothetical protein
MNRYIDSLRTLCFENQRGAHECEHVTEKSHVFGHGNGVDGQVAKGRVIN